MSERIELGNYVKDIVTGFSGVAVSRTEYLNGCVRYGVQSNWTHEGRPISPEYIDQEQLRRIDSPLAVTVAQKPTGGPGDPPRRSPDLTR